MLGRRLSAIGCSLVEDHVRILRLHWLNPRRVTLHTGTLAVAAQTPSAQPSVRELFAPSGRSIVEALNAPPDVVTCLPPEQVRYHRLRIAPMPDEEVAAAVFWQVSKELGWKPQSLRTDFYESAELSDAGKRRREVIAVAVSDTDLNSHLGTLRAVGLSPTAVDTTAGALARCLMPLGSTEDDEPWLVVDLGVPTSTIMLVRAGAPRFVHSVSRPPAQDLVELASNLAHEINLCLHDLNSSGYERCQPRKGCVVGSIDHEQKILAALDEGAGLEFRWLADCLAAPLREIASALPSHDPIDQWLVPLGLALYGRESLMESMAA